MVILIMIVLTHSGVSSNKIRFSKESSCLKAIERLIKSEKGFTVKAVCVKDE